MNEGRVLTTCADVSLCVHVEHRGNHSGSTALQFGGMSWMVSAVQRKTGRRLRTSTSNQHLLVATFSMPFDVAILQSCKLKDSCDLHRTYSGGRCSLLHAIVVFRPKYYELGQTYPSADAIMMPSEPPVV